MLLALGSAPWETIGLVAGVIVAVTLIFCVFKLARDRGIR
jgi:hypothetical protein